MMMMMMMMMMMVFPVLQAQSNTSRSPDSNGAKPLNANAQSEQPVMSFTESLDIPDEVPVRGSTCDLGLPGQKILWVASPKPPNANQVNTF